MAYGRPLYGLTDSCPIGEKLSLIVMIDGRPCLKDWRQQQKKHLGLDEPMMKEGLGGVPAF